MMTYAMKMIYLGRWSAFAWIISFPGSNEQTMASTTAFKDRNLIAVIGDEVCSLLTRVSTPLSIYQDSITGLLLAGVGHINEHQRKNFLVVDSSKVFAILHVVAHSLLSRNSSLVYRSGFSGVHPAQGYRNRPYKPACELEASISYIFWPEISCAPR